MSTKKRYKYSRVIPDNPIINKWVNENLPGELVYCKGQYEKLLNDKTSASWGCNNPVVNGFKLAWIILSPQHKGQNQITFFDFIVIS